MIPVIAVGQIAKPGIYWVAERTAVEDFVRTLEFGGHCNLRRVQLYRGADGPPRDSIGLVTKPRSEVQSESRVYLEKNDVVGFLYACEHVPDEHRVLKPSQCYVIERKR